MLLEKMEYDRLDAPFAEKKVDINTGDIVKILSDAKKQPSRFDVNKDSVAIKIQTKNGARYINLNQQSINILINEFKTNDAKDWIGKEAKILLNPTIIGGKKVIVAYLTSQSYVLDEWGAPVNTAEGVDSKVEEEVPTINLDEEIPTIDPSEVPF